MLGNDFVASIIIRQPMVVIAFSPPQIVVPYSKLTLIQYDFDISRISIQ